MEYNKILKDALNCIEWDDLIFEVHHINHDRNDNRISNLLLLPKKLHKKYHLLLRYASCFCDDIIKKDVGIIPKYHIDTISKLIECKNDMAYLYQEQANFIDKVNKTYLVSKSDEDTYIMKLQDISDKYN